MQELPEQYQGAAGAEEILARKSWAAYVPSILIAAVALLGFVPFLWNSVRPLAIVLAVITIAFTTYTILLLRSYRLVMNDEGVWLYRGILPWHAGGNGVDWRDMSKAVYFTGFKSWICRAYSVEVQHRFTQGNALFVSQLHLGHEAVAKINKAHQLYLSRYGTH